MTKNIIKNWFVRIEWDKDKFHFLNIMDYIITIMLRTMFLYMGIWYLQLGNIYGILLFLPLILVNFNFEFIRDWKWEKAPLVRLWRWLRKSEGYSE